MGVMREGDERGVRMKGEEGGRNEGDWVGD